MRLILLALSTLGQTAEIDGAQFLRMMEELHADIADVSFTFECVIEFPKSDNPAESLKQIQGRYFYRSDGATSIDSYSRSGGVDAPLMRTRLALLEGRMERNTDIPDRMVQPGRTFVESGSSVQLTQSGSPHRIFYHWYFAPSNRARLHRITPLGWERIGEHECLKVRVGLSESSEKLTITFWVDLKRGGHPLRVEWRDGEELWILIHDIRLHAYDVNNKTIWLPVHGVSEAYWDGKAYYRTPIAREDYDVVHGSARFNDQPPDEQFTVEALGGPPPDPRLRPLHDELERQIAEAEANRPEVPTDPIGVRERLDQRLAEAEEQAAMIEASSAARQVWNSSRILQLVIGAFGVAAVVSAFVLWRRYR